MRRLALLLSLPAALSAPGCALDQVRPEEARAAVRAFAVIVDALAYDRRGPELPAADVEDLAAGVRGDTAPADLAADVAAALAARLLGRSDGPAFAFELRRVLARLGLLSRAPPDPMLEAAALGRRPP